MNNINVKGKRERNSYWMETPERIAGPEEYDRIRNIHEKQLEAKKRISQKVSKIEALKEIHLNSKKANE